MALTNQFSKGPASQSIPSTLVRPDGSQASYPFLWVLGQGPLTTTTPGTDVAATDGTFYAGGIFVPHVMVVTGATNLIGSVGGTDKVIYYIWDDNGVVVAWTALAGTTVGTAATMQTRLAFVEPVTLEGPSLYYGGVIFNGTTAKFRAHAIGNGPALEDATGVFGTNSALTTATTFTASKAPVMGLY